MAWGGLSLLLLLGSVPLSWGREDWLNRFRASVAHAKVGEWVLYQVEGGTARRSSFWRLAVVGEVTEAPGREAVWVEMELGQEVSLRAPLLQVRMLWSRQGKGMEALRRLFVAVGAERIREVNPAQLPTLLALPETERGPPAPPSPPLLKPLPATSLVTSMGTLRASGFELHEHGVLLQRVYLSEQVPLLHLVRLELPGVAHRIEVRDFGTQRSSQMKWPDSETEPLELTQESSP